MHVMNPRKMNREDKIALATCCLFFGLAMLIAGKDTMSRDYYFEGKCLIKDHHVQISYQYEDDYTKTYYRMLFKVDVVNTDLKGKTGMIDCYNNGWQSFKTKNIIKYANGTIHNCLYAPSVKSYDPKVFLVQNLYDYTVPDYILLNPIKIFGYFEDGLLYIAVGILFTIFPCIFLIQIHYKTD